MSQGSHDGSKKKNLHDTMGSAMFGGIAAGGGNRLVYVTRFGRVLTLDTDTGLVVHSFSLLPYGDELKNFSACAVGADGSVFVADPRRKLVRRFAQGGRQIARYGQRPIPGVRSQDAQGVLDGPCALALMDEEIFVCCAGDDLIHGVQRFGLDGESRPSLQNSGDPLAPWKRPRGITHVDGEIWIGESFAGLIRIHRSTGDYLRALEINERLGRPVRLEQDGYGGVLLILEPSEPGAEDPGIARVSSQGEFDEEWVVKPGEAAGSVRNGIDLAFLPDGRFAVADVPVAGLAEVRVQLFSSDGRLQRVLVEGEEGLRRQERDYAEEAWARPAGTADELYEQAALHHNAGSDHFGQAGALYEQALRAAPDHAMAHLGFARLLEEGLADPERAETEYRAAIAAGEPEGELLARVAECRRMRDDLDGAIEILKAAVEDPSAPEDYDHYVELLADYFLARAGQDPGDVQY